MDFVVAAVAADRDAIQKALPPATQPSRPVAMQRGKTVVR